MKCFQKVINYLLKDLFTLYYIARSRVCLKCVIKLCNTIDIWYKIIFFLSIWLHISNRFVAGVLSSSLRCFIGFHTSITVYVPTLTIIFYMAVSIYYDVFTFVTYHISDVVLDKKLHIIRNITMIIGCLLWNSII